MEIKKIRRLAVASGIAFLGFSCSASVGQARTMPGPNPWVYNLSDPTKGGILINGVKNSGTQILEIKDPYGQPIFGVGHFGGASVYGDHFRVFGGNDIFHPVIDIGPDSHINIRGTRPTVTINGQTLTSSDIAWIHKQRGIK